VNAEWGEGACMQTSSPKLMNEFLQDLTLEVCTKKSVCELNFDSCTTDINLTLQFNFA